MHLLLTIRPLPFLRYRTQWEAVIEDFAWLHGFCDRQLRGPFKYWRHCHVLTPHATGTHLSDDIEYQLPLGPLNGIANKYFIRRQLTATFRYRQQRTLELLTSAAT